MGVSENETNDWPKKLDLFGVAVSATNYREAVTAIVLAASRGSSAVVSCHAVHAIVAASYDSELREKVNSFEIITPDGQPVCWALNLFSKAGLKDRVYGPELMLQLCAAAVEKKISIFLYGSVSHVLAKLQARLEVLTPNLKIAGALSPPFRPLTQVEDYEAVRQINASGAAIVFIGLGCPKQDLFAFEHRDKLDAVQVCVGAAFDFHAQVKPMAPGWMQKLGLEWLFRLLHEPRRLGPRYMITNSLFIWKCIGKCFRMLYEKQTTSN
jgi:N-acetylglucosaminyldiphosphoundecaprenol N-acetyl-beta-D-mannosaminyltransferase